MLDRCLTAPGGQAAAKRGLLRFGTHPKLLLGCLYRPLAERSGPRVGLSLRQHQVARGPQTPCLSGISNTDFLPRLIQSAWSGTQDVRVRGWAGRLAWGRWGRRRGGAERPLAAEAPPSPLSGLGRREGVACGSAVGPLRSPARIPLHIQLSRRPGPGKSRAFAPGLLDRHKGAPVGRP